MAEGAHRGGLTGWAEGTHKKVAVALKRVEHWLPSAMFIGLGLYIIIESGVVPRLIPALWCNEGLRAS